MRFPASPDNRAPSRAFHPRRRRVASALEGNESTGYAVAPPEAAPLWPHAVSSNPGRSDYVLQETRQKRWGELRVARNPESSSSFAQFVEKVLYRVVQNSIKN